MIFFFTDMNKCGHSQLLLKIREAALAGVDYILIRENQLDDASYYDLTLSALQMLTGTQSELVLCHRDAIADMLGLKKHNRFNERTEESFTVSTHSGEEIDQLNNQLFFFSPIFPSVCKPGVKPKGLLFSHPNMIALGGVNKETVNELNSIHHIGIMSEWIESHELYELVKYYKKLGY